MWLYSRRFLISAIGAATLGACGLTPVYGPSGGAAALQNAVMVQAPQTRAEFELVRAFEQHFGAAKTQVYTLSYDLSMAEEAVVISTSRALQRYNIIGELEYTLTNGKDKKVAMGKIRNFTAYFATGTVIANSSAQQDAENRLMVLLTKQAISDINLQVLK